MAETLGNQEGGKQPFDLTGGFNEEWWIFSISLSCDSNFFRTSTPAKRQAIIISEPAAQQRNQTGFLFDQASHIPASERMQNIAKYNITHHFILPNPHNLSANPILQRFVLVNPLKRSPQCSPSSTQAIQPHNRGRKPVDPLPYPSEP